MKSVLLSIQPKWCELIAKGKKTVEVRKTRPKLETPFKCYIYKTKKRILRDVVRKGEQDWFGDIANETQICSCPDWNGGKVIGEFVCDEIEEYKYYSNDTIEGYAIGKSHPCSLSAMQLTMTDFVNYGKGKPLYGWHISDLKIYDKPKELNKFYRIEKNGEDVFASSIKRPPQSWCYFIEGLRSIDEIMPANWKTQLEEYLERWRNATARRETL